MMVEFSGDYAATFRLINNFRRIGKLSLAIEYLNRLQDANLSVRQESGFNFALGLYYW